MMDMAYHLHLINLLAKLYRQQLIKVKVGGTLSEWFHFHFIYLFISHGTDKLSTLSC